MLRPSRAAIGRRSEEEVDEARTVSTDRRLHLRGRADTLRHRRDRSRDLRASRSPATTSRRKASSSVPPPTQLWPGACGAMGREPVETGSQALAFAEIMREHTLARDGRPDLLRRWAGSSPPTSPSDQGRHQRRGRGSEGRERSAGLERRPRHLGHGDCALTTALNMGFMAEMLSVFSIVVGVAFAPDRHRPGDPCAGGLRAGEAGDGDRDACRGAGSVIGPCGLRPVRARMRATGQLRSGRADAPLAS